MSIGAHDLTILADISYRQLDFWTRSGLLQAHDRDEFTRQGYPRSYDDDQAHICVLMGRLTKAGFQARHARKLADDLLEHGQTGLAGGFVLTMPAAAEVPDQGTDTASRIVTPINRKASA